MKYNLKFGSSLRARACVPGVLLLSLVAASGCFSYVPVDPGEVAPSEPVRVRISDTAATRLASDFGAYVHTLSGQLVRSGTDSLSLSIPLSRFTNGVSLGDTRQTLVFSRPEVLEVSRRKLSAGRTALVTAGVVGGFVLLVTSITQTGEDGDENGNPPPPPPLDYIGVFRIPLPLGR